jgi:hypothetical protein
VTSHFLSLTRRAAGAALPKSCAVRGIGYRWQERRNKRSVNTGRHLTQRRKARGPRCQMASSPFGAIASPSGQRRSGERCSASHWAYTVFYGMK